MAYVTQYSSVFSNELNHQVEVELQLKDGPTVTPAEFLITKLEINDDSDEGTIIARECVLGIEADANTTITWETFLPSTTDAWKIIIRIGDTLQTLFIGFLTPEEGNSPFLDKPYKVLLRATNGLKLLKDAPLKNLLGENFKGRFHVLDYIVAALRLNLLNDIPIRIYCSIYESSMQDRGDDIMKDWYNQAKLDHRRFLKDPVTFESAYQTLLIILKRHSRIFFWNGMWVIFYMAEHQYRPAGLYYTQYDPDGAVTTGEIETEGVGKVGSGELIYPINEDAIISAHFAIKTARTEFKYDIWPEIPLNNKFERGTFSLLLSGINYRSYTIDDWTYGRFNSVNANFPFNPVAATAFRKSTYNAFGIEIEREVILPPNANTGLNIYLLSEGMPTNANDKVIIEFDYRHLQGSDGYGTRQIGRVYLYPTGATTGPYYLDANGNWHTGATASMTHFYDTGEDSSVYQTFRIETKPFPVTGTLYMLFTSTDIAIDQDYYRNFNIEYQPFVAGGYIQVKGDVWTHSQNANMIDVDSADILISDSLIYVAKGAIWRDNGISITTPTWYRYGTQEVRHFKELVNLFRFNLGYRRFYKIEGNFTGLFYEPKNDQLNKQLISWHKEYELTNLSPMRQFILAPPLQMDIVTGNIHAEFQEVLNPANSTTVTETVDQLIQRIASEVNNTTEDEWNDAAGAPPSGTPFFPPQAGLYTFTPHKLILSMNDADNATLTVDVNGQGNSPSVTEIFNSAGTESRLILWELGTDIVPGNIFTLTIYGVEIVVTVQEITTYDDGTQDGDTQVFNYLF